MTAYVISWIITWFASSIKTATVTRYPWWYLTPSGEIYLSLWKGNMVSQVTRTSHTCDAETVTSLMIAHYWFSKKGDHYEACLYRGGHAEESGALKSLQCGSADQNADNVGTCDKMNNESLENYVTCDDLFPGVNAYRNMYKRNFIFLHVNINSFRHKFAPMQPILSNRKVDLLVISESKLDSTFPYAQFNVDGFCIYRQDYTASSGGLLVYMRSDIAHRRLVQHEINMDGIESRCIEVHNNKLRRVNVCIYKHPSVSDTVFLTHLSQMADRLLIICPDIVFIGDMNCCPKKSDAIKEFCELYHMKNLIASPTCHKGPSPTILDVILVSQPKRFTESLNCECPLNDFHNIIGGATKQYEPFEQSNNPVKFIIGVIRTSMTMDLSTISIMPLSTSARFSTILMIYRGSKAVY